MRHICTEFISIKLENNRVAPQLPNIKLYYNERFIFAFTVDLSMTVFRVLSNWESFGLYVFGFARKLILPLIDHFGPKVSLLNHYNGDLDAIICSMHIIEKSTIVRNFIFFSIYKSN